ncbi:MAG: transglutaminase domain-containing protein [Dehalococcoidia bacterium]|nr:MAG: transglutaminase domain-containing protein [Dehalococcoidia bacterium]
MVDMEKYSRCTEIIDCDTESVFAKAQELTGGLQTDREKAIALFYFVRDEIKHDPYATGMEYNRYKASLTLESGQGFCSHKSILLTALARAVGIPARLGFVAIHDHLMSDAFRKMIGGTNILPLHGYAELNIDGKWVHASPSYDLAVCQKNWYVPVEFDGINDAKDSPYDQEGRVHVEHIKDHGTFDDLPWDWMWEYLREHVAEQGFNWDELIDSWEQGIQSRLSERDLKT